MPHVKTNCLGPAAERIEEKSGFQFMLHWKSEKSRRESFWRASDNLWLRAAFLKQFFFIFNFDFSGKVAGLKHVNK